MKNDWILDVLADLTAFAHANNLPALAEQLGKTADTANAEIQSTQQGVTVSHGDDGAGGTYLGGVGDRQRA